MKIALLFVVMLPVLASGQVRRSQLEKAGDRHELRQDRRERGDDWRDTAKLEGVLASFERARASNDLRGLSQVDDLLAAMLATELAEGKRELAKDGAELRRDSRELRSDRREVRRDVAAGRPVAAMGDRHDKRDDRRDRRDDVRDARVETASIARTVAIAAELAPLRGVTDALALDRKRGLIVELIALSRSEQIQDGAERREDKRELREDRRELREDRRTL